MTINVYPSNLPKDVKAIWGLAFQHAMKDPRITRDIETSRTLDVKQITGQDFLRECAWAIYGAAFSFRVLEQKWPALNEAFLEWDAQKIVAGSGTVEQEALRIIAHHRKVNAVITISGILASQGWHKLRSKLLGLIAWDAQDNPCESQALLDYLDSYPQVGQTLAAYIAKNIGVASIKPDLWMLRLADWLGLPDNKDGVMDMARKFQVECGENIQTIDAALWNWAKEQQELCK